VLDARFRELWQARDSLGTALAEDSAVRTRLIKLVTCAASASSEQARLLIRSNGPAECLHPGEGATAVVRAELSAVEAALEDALRDFVGSLPLVQIAIEPSVLGLMSNERAWTPRRDTWLVEGNLRLRGPEVARLRGTTAPDLEEALTASTTTGVLRCLRRVGGLLASRDGEWRVEWLWDAERVWIVQADRLKPPQPDGIAMRYLTSRDARPPRRVIEAPEQLTPPNPEQLTSPKLEAWRTFRRLGWPTYPLHALTGADWRRRRDRDELDAWLTQLCADLMVVRTDLLAAGDHNQMLLPTSSPSRDPRAVGRFMDEAAEHFRVGDVSDTDWAFLISPLVRARASAFARAMPGDGPVDLDALWGFPDGLLHLPHDSCTVGVSEEIGYKPRHKPLCLLADDDGWNLRPVAAPLDWKRTLQKDEVVQIAAWARALAIRANAPVMLMALAKIDGVQGARACLPFFAGPVQSTPEGLKGQRIHEASYARVTTPADLVALRSRPSQPAGIDLLPTAAWIRDPSFLRAVAEYSAALGVPIVFHGSLLGHASYVLRGRGASLITTVGAAASAVDSSSSGRRASYPLVVLNSDGLARVEALEQNVARAALRHQLELDAKDSRAPIGRYERNTRALHAMSRGVSAFVAPGPKFERLGMVTGALLKRDLLMRDEPGVAAGFMRPAASDMTDA
jgi:hypothetical protein